VSPALTAFVTTMALSDSAKRFLELLARVLLCFALVGAVPMVRSTCSK
jgi:hypothetical protein